VSDLKNQLFPGEEAFSESVNLDYRWMLDEHERTDHLTKFSYFEYSAVKEMFENADKLIDPLYLVKWRNLSYLDCTWEPLSKIAENEKQLKDFERFNRSLDNSSRQKMMGFSYAHRQLLKIFEKKLKSGRKVD
jgi:Chromo (CHRromatin Organisation MOdifier) domain